MEQNVTLVAGTLESLARMVPWVRGLLFGAAAIGGWAASLQWSQHKMGEEIVDLKKQAHTFELWMTESNGNRYTTGDHSKYATEATAVTNGLDKRTQRLEDTSKDVKDALTSIKTTVDRLDRNFNFKP